MAKNGAKVSEPQGEEQSDANPLLLLAASAETLQRRQQLPTELIESGQLLSPHVSVHDPHVHAPARRQQRGSPLTDEELLPHIIQKVPNNAPLPPSPLS